jgi:hypothetical protein
MGMSNGGAADVGVGVGVGGFELRCEPNYTSAHF